MSHAEGENTRAEHYSHSEGMYTKAGKTRDQMCHSEGYQTISIGYASHAEGNCCIAGGDNGTSHAEGENTIAYADGAHAEGT
jgi:hypothetical protein